MAYDPQYYKQYYKDHKEEILAARGEKYKKDPRYRSGILKRARVAAVIRVLSNQKQREAARIVHAGKPERFYYVSHMEKMVNRDRSVLDVWRKSDPPIIPPALYYDKRGRGVYSESQIMFISKALHRLDLGKLAMTYNDLRLLLQDVWSETFSEKRLTLHIREILHGRHYKEGSCKVRKVRKSNPADNGAE